MYDVWNPYDPSPLDTPGERQHLEQRLAEVQEALHFALLDLRPVIENAGRDSEQVYRTLRTFYDHSHNTPAHIDDLPVIEVFCRRVLEKGGTGQSNLQTELLRLVGNTASPASLPFLLEMLRFSRRGDSFGPERRMLALWGLARIAKLHNLPEAYAALQTGLNDRKAEVRGVTMDLILDAYLDAGRDIPPEVTARLKQMARDDPDEDVRQLADKYLGKASSR